VTVAGVFVAFEESVPFPSWPAYGFVLVHLTVPLARTAQLWIPCWPSKL
jgi:hypothetical protein